MSPSLIEYLTDDQVVNEALEVAKKNCYSPPVSSRIFEHDGLFSKTTCVTLEDNNEVIVQFKDNEIDTTKMALARGLLGNLVPFTFSASTSIAHYAYVSDLIKGTMWYNMKIPDTSRDPKAPYAVECKIVSQLGELLSRCRLNTSSDGVVDFFIIPRLKHILLKENISYEPLKKRIDRLLKHCGRLKALPLALCHIDLNERNILLDEGHNIGGIVDWEMAALLPLGSNAWCIRHLSVNIVKGMDHDVPERSNDMAKAFWNGFVDTKSLVEHKHCIVIAMQVGFLLSTFFGGGCPKTDKLPQIDARLKWMEDTFSRKCVDA